MSALRVALVGVGPRSIYHMDAIDKCEGFVMACGVDPDEKSAERYMSRYQTPFYADMDEMLRKEKPDVVSICTREHPRHKLTMSALDAGVKVIALEKPMARNVAEARQMFARAKEKGAILVVSHQTVFCDEFEAARKAIESGEIGTPYFVRATSFGQMMEQGPHMIDMILFQLDAPEVDWVMASVGDIEEGHTTVHPAPAFTVGYIAFKNGARAVLECGRKFQKALSVPEDVTWLQARFQALGEEGMVDAILSHYCRLMNPSTNGWKTLAEGPEGWNESTNRFYAELYRVATEGGTHRNNADVSLKGFEIIHAMYQSALTRERVVPPIPADARPLEEIMGG